MRFPTIENFTSVVPSTGLPNVYLQKKKIRLQKIIIFFILISVRWDSTSGSKKKRFRNWFKMEGRCEGRYN